MTLSLSRLGYPASPEPPGLSHLITHTHQHASMHKSTRHQAITSARSTGAQLSTWSQRAKHTFLQRRTLQILHAYEGSGMRRPWGSWRRPWWCFRPRPGASVSTLAPLCAAIDAQSAHGPRLSGVLMTFPFSVFSIMIVLPFFVKLTHGWLHGTPANLCAT